MRADKAQDFMLFKGDGTLVLFQGGRTYSGRYETVRDGQLELVIDGVKQRAREEEDAVIDPNGTRWVRAR